MNDEREEIAYDKVWNEGTVAAITIVVTVTKIV